MGKIVIQVESLSKRYRLGIRGNRRLAEDVTRWWARVRGREDPFLKIGAKTAPALPGNVLWALRDVSFEVNEGEVLGVIGLNGSGKSTLLKIMSRLTAPTTGEVRVRGRVASLLEVGTGFHPDLTGRENIFLNGAILGMTKAEIRAKFDEIVDFSEVEQFIDTPVKRYSSGMYVRLAFAVAAHLEPEILIVDEVLAVGDANFQKKCLGKMQDVAGGGRTILFVSHNMIAVQSLCHRAILLNHGRLQADGLSGDVIEGYMRDLGGAKPVAEWNEKTAPGSEEVRFSRLSAAAPDGQPLSMSGPFTVTIEYRVLKVRPALHMVLHLINDQGLTVLTSGFKPAPHERGAHRVACHFPAHLLNSGSHCVRLLIVENGNQVTFRLENALSFDILDLAKRDSAWMGREPGVVRPRLEWTRGVAGGQEVLPA